MRSEDTRVCLVCDKHSDDYKLDDDVVCWDCLIDAEKAAGEDEAIKSAIKLHGEAVDAVVKASEAFYVAWAKSKGLKFRDTAPAYDGCQGFGPPYSGCTPEFTDASILEKLARIADE